MSSETTTVGKYLIQRLKEIGIDHIFGVPGDFVLGFCKVLEKSEIKFINTCNELNASYAADAYARIKGVGCVTTTYGVGELSALNGVAGSFAESIPVVVITGSPTTTAQKIQPLLHHTLGDYTIPKRMFQLITAETVTISNGSTAPNEIDKVLKSCIHFQKPVYISLPTDLVNEKCSSPVGTITRYIEESDPETLKEALEEAIPFIEASESPIIIADVELKRYHLEKDFSKLLEKTLIPYAVLMMGKSVLSESHPQFIGLYEGRSSREYVRNRVENADCILQLGTLLTDFNTGGFTMANEPRRIISANYNKVQIKNHIYNNVLLKDFINGLESRLKKKDPTKLNIHKAIDGCSHRRTVEFKYQSEKPITSQRFFDAISHFIPENSIVIAETGTAQGSIAETFMPNGVTFISQIFYGSIGYTVGAALGAAIADPSRRVLVFIGDGSFQVTCQDLSTMIRYGVNPIIFLLNNDGYTIERVIIDGTFNDIQPWKYSLLPEIFGGRKGIQVKTEGQLEQALKQVNKDLAFIEICTDRLDCSDALKNSGKFMAKNNCIVDL